MHIHILGICGTFMGGIAAIARESGHRVTGCDANVYPPMSDQLKALGIELIEGFDPSQIRLQPDLWVIGNVVSRGNPLMEAILDQGLPYVSGPQWLAEQVLRDRWVLAVAGTHGKTTTSSLLAWILHDCGLEPGFLIGGIARDFGVSARLGRSRYFVIEADEYDTAFFDKRSKFVHYRPRTAILNNLEFDHADIFPDLAAIETQFHHLIRTVPGSGRLVVNGRDLALERVLSRVCWSERIDFEVEQGWHARELVESAQTSEFTVCFDQTVHGRCRLALAGSHNRSNALAAIAAAAHVGVEPADAIAAIGRFSGVARRLELRGQVDGVSVIDDFAHHPSAIETTIAGLRARLQSGERILAVLEPRSNTMKLGTMSARLPDSLAQADAVFCYSGGISWDIASALTPLQGKLVIEAQLPRLVQTIVEQARPGDQILVMSNGGFGGIHQLLLDALKMRATTRRGRLIYLHGFRSSPQSFKARLLAERMQVMGRQGEFICPQLPPSPRAAMELVLGQIAPTRQDTLVGSSLGGLYATWLAERVGCRAVLLNPAVQPARDLKEYNGPRTMFHSDEPFEFRDEYLDEMRALQIERITGPERYFLIAAKGDELLDWREMVGHYPGAKLHLLEGSDHGLSDFADYIDEVLAFAGSAQNKETLA